MLKLKINSDNQAFDQEGQEVARILRGLADQVEHLDKLQECQLPLRDLNGNTVGYYQTWTDQGKSQGAVISSPYATWTAKTNFQIKPGGFGLLFLPGNTRTRPGQNLANRLDQLEIEWFFAICSLQNRLQTVRTKCRGIRYPRN